MISCLCACSFDGSGAGGPGGGSPGTGSPDTGGGGGDGSAEPTRLRVSGSFSDWRTGAPLEPASFLVEGISGPDISLDGSSFVLDAVPPHSVLYLTVISPGYRQTVTPVTVGDTAIEGLELEAVAEADLDAYAADFEFDASAGVFLSRAITEEGDPEPSISSDAYLVSGAGEIEGPFFLDEALAAAPDRETTSGSGYALFAGLAPGLVSLSGKDPYTLRMPATPVAEGAVAIVDVEVTVGDPQLTENVSFSEDVVPVFGARGCLDCHTANGEGKDLGGLALDGLNGDAQQAYEEITIEVSPNEGETRVNLENPEASLLLTRPSVEDPPDVHPWTTFYGPTDPDYVTILSWISAGAPNN